MRYKYIITGQRNAGKTHFCMRLTDWAKRRKIDIAGIVSPGVFEGCKKIRIDAKDIRAEEVINLAVLKSSQEEGIFTDCWFFNRETVEWGNSVLGQATPCSVLFIDELGPLEFTRQTGWVSGLRIIDEGEYQKGFFGVRPELVDVAKQRWQDAHIVQLTIRNRNFISWLFQMQMLMWR